MDKVKEQAAQTAEKAKVGAHEVQGKAQDAADEVKAKRELIEAQGELGRKAFELIERGELSNPELEADAAKIRDLNTRIAAHGGGA